MDYLNRYLVLILACGTLALFLAGPAMAQTNGNQGDGQWGTEDWAFEYLEGIYKKDFPEKDSEYYYKVNGQYLVVLFNIAMDQGQSFGGSIFEFHESDNRRQPQVGNNGNNLSIVHQVGNSSVDTFAIVSQDGDGNVGIIRQLGPH